MTKGIKRLKAHCYILQREGMLAVARGNCFLSLYGTNPWNLRVENSPSSLQTHAQDWGCERSLRSYATGFLFGKVKRPARRSECKPGDHPNGPWILTELVEKTSVETCVQWKTGFPNRTVVLEKFLLKTMLFFFLNNSAPQAYMLQQKIEMGFRFQNASVGPHVNSSLGH